MQESLFPCFAAIGSSLRPICRRHPLRMRLYCITLGDCDVDRNDEPRERESRALMYCVDSLSGQENAGRNVACADVSVLSTGGV